MSDWRLDDGTAHPVTDSVGNVIDDGHPLKPRKGGSGRPRVVLGLDANAYDDAAGDAAWEAWRDSEWNQWHEAGRPDGWVWERDPAAAYRDHMVLTLLRSLRAALADEGHWCADQVGIIASLFTDRQNTCAACGRPVNQTPGSGRPAEYCTDVCRKLAKAKRRSDLRKQVPGVADVYPKLPVPYEGNLWSPGSASESDPRHVAPVHGPPCSRATKRETDQ